MRCILSRIRLSDRNFELPIVASQGFKGQNGIQSPVSNRDLQEYYGRRRQANIPLRFGLSRIFIGFFKPIEHFRISVIDSCEIDLMRAHRICRSYGHKLALGVLAF